jgi:hypothetical protein
MLFSSSEKVLDQAKTTAMRLVLTPCAILFIVTRLRSAAHLHHLFHHAFHHCGTISETALVRTAFCHLLKHRLKTSAGRLEVSASTFVLFVFCLHS